MKRLPSHEIKGPGGSLPLRSDDDAAVDLDTFAAADGFLYCIARRGVTGVAVGSGSGGVEPNPLSGHGGCNRRGSKTGRSLARHETTSQTYSIAVFNAFAAHTRTIATTKANAVHLTKGSSRPALPLGPAGGIRTGARRALGAETSGH